MTDKADLDENISSNSALREAAEKKLGKSLSAPNDIKERTSEEIIHELQVHQIELEMQNEELKRIQLELEESSDKYRELYDFAPVGYFTLSYKGIIRDVNLTGASLLGTPRPELINRGFGRFVTHESEGQWDQHIIAVLGHEEKQSCDLTLKRADGSIFYAGLESIRMDKPVDRQAETGSPYVVRVAVSDITDRKAAEEAVRKAKDELELKVLERTAELKESRDRFQGLVENTSDWVWEVNETWVYTYVSPKVRDILGYEPQEVIDKTRFDLMDHEEARRVSDLLTIITSSRKPLMGLENTNLHRDGHMVVLETNAAPFFGPDGAFRGYRGIDRDITERKRLDADRLDMQLKLAHAQKFESLSAMAGGIAHDLNNLLAVVLGNLDLALDDLPSDSEARLSVENAIKAAERLAELSTQMLTYTGGAVYFPVELDLNELISRNLNLMKLGVSQHVSLKVDSHGKLPPIKGDADQIRRLVINILVNASEATGDEEGTVQLSTGIVDCDEKYLSHSRLEEKPEPGRFVFLEVTDTGCGMDDETLRRLLDPFFSKKFVGRGLGMAEVMGIVKGHHGALFVVSQLGKGTTIRVLFPVLNRTQTSFIAYGESVKTESRSPRAINRPKTILLVEDETGVRDLTVRRLEVLGYDTIIAADGEEGVRIFRERLKEIDAVILDLVMPRLNGVEAFDELIRIKPNVKVILCSGYTEDDVLLSFPRERPAGVLHKPYTMTDLERELDRLVGIDS